MIGMSTGAVLHGVRRWAPISGVAGAALLLTACGATATPAANKPSSSQAPGLAVKTATISVGGSPTEVLTNAADYTLYYFIADAATHPVCTSKLIAAGGSPCSTIWPPLLGGHVTAPAGVTGSFTVFNGANGNQIEYNGHPLYTYSLDTGPKQSHGEGVLGKWYVATPSLAQNTAAAAAPSPSASSSSSSGGSSYYG
ncbi:MAG: COG4315 family predicted lipoprotein [Candidatus Dormibacteria bacterium]